MNKSQGALEEALRLHLFGLYTVNGLQFLVFGFKRKEKNGTKRKNKKSEEKSETNSCEAPSDRVRNRLFVSVVTYFVTKRHKLRKSFAKY